MSEALKTELVNFRELDSASDSKRCAELARHVATLFAYTSDRCSVEQVDTYDGVLLRLVDMVETEVRKYVAEKMAGLRRGPEQTVRRLASDNIEVAEPILRQSTVLREADLVEIAGETTDGHRCAIAKREVISEAVTDVLVERGNIVVKRLVAANSGASVSDSAMLSLISDAGSDATMQMSLSARADLAEHHIGQLVRVASAEVRRDLLARGDKQDASRVSEAADIAAQRMSNEYWLARYDFETAGNRILRLAQAGMVSEASLRRFASEDRFAEAVAAFAWMVRCGVQEVSHWMVRVDPEPFLIIARASGLSSITVSSLLSIGPWRHRLSSEARANAMKTFNALSVGDAKRRMAHWGNLVIS